MAKNIGTDLTTGSVSHQLWKFSLPFFLANLLQSLYGVADALIVGRFVGSAALSGVSIGSQVMMIFTLVCMGITTGANILIAQYAGAKKTDELIKTVGNTFTIALIGAAAMAVLGYACHNWLLKILNTPAEAFDQASGYLLVTLSGIFFVFIYNAICAVLRGQGDSKSPMIFVAVTSVLNVVLDILFVGTFKMEAFGAGLATVLSQALCCVFAFVYLKFKKFFAGYSLACLKLQAEKVKMILKLGIPVAVQMASLSVSLTFVTAIINQYGVAASAAVGVGHKIESLATMPNMAVGNAATIMIGQNIGAGQNDRVKYIVRTSILTCCAITVVTFTATQLFAEFFIGIFNTEPEVIRYGALYIRIIAATFIAHCFLSTCNGVATAVGFPMLTLVATLVDSVAARIPLCILLGGIWGITGVYIAMAAAPFAGLAISAGYYLSGKWKTRQLVKSE